MSERELDTLYRTLTSSLPDVMVFLLDRDLRILLAEGDAWRGLPWFDETKFVGRRVHDLHGEVPEEVLGPSIEHFAAAVAGERREFTFADAGATVSVVAAPVSAAGGDADAAAVVITRDITRQTDADAELRQRRELHRTLSSNNPDTAVGIVDEGMRWVILEGERVLTDLGVAEDAIGKLLEDTHGELGEALRPLVERALDGRAGAFEWPGPGGRTYLVRAAPLETVDGAHQATVAVTDVSERRAADARLYESRTRFERAFENGPTGMVLMSLEGKAKGTIVRVNQALCDLLGYAESELVGRRATDLAHPEGVAGITAAGHALARGDMETVSAERRYVTATGESVWLGVNVSVVPDAQGRRRYALAHTTDLTARKRGEQEAVEAARLWQAAFTSALDAMIVADDSRAIRAANDAACAMLGVERERLVGRSLDDFCVASAWLRGFRRGATPGEEARGEVPMTTDIGERLDVEYSLAPHFMPARHLLVLRDVSERKREEAAREAGRAEQRRLETELHQFQRLETVGQLAGGIAHDFNNLLAVIRHCAEFALDDPEGQAVAEEVREIQKAADRAAALTRQLLTFSRQETARTEKVDINSVITDVDRMLRRTLGEHILFERSLDPANPLALADSRQVEQVLVNLAVNARDAMNGGGTLTIESSTVTLHEEFARMRADVAPGRYVRIAVHDTGAGMPEGVRARAFDPFFTTKPNGLGTGLGLATTYGIVKEAGGHVEIESREHAGTTVTVYLPLTDGVPSSRPPEPPEPPEIPPGDGGRILVVEDEAAVRRVASRILAGHGYEVVSAATPAEALQHAAAVDLVLSDVVLPGMSGGGLVTRLRETRPDLPVVFMSGYIDPSDTLPPHAAFLGKPFTRADLLEQVARALNGAPAR
jgi:two-component system cell cycle sensor histidine kinase/response regulator CckA